MKSRWKWIAVSMICLGLVGCFGGYSWNQTMTIYVQTPDGVKSGSSVTTIKWWDNFFSGGWGGARMHSSYRGSSAVVDLGEGKYLFQIMAGHNTSSHYIAHLATSTNSVPSADGYAVGAAAFQEWFAYEGELVIPKKEWPELVMFTELTDPTSVKLVTHDTIQALLGKGFAISKVTLERVSEEPSCDKVVGLIPWVKDKKLRSLDGSRLGDPYHSGGFASSLDRSSFCWMGK